MKPMPAPLHQPPAPDASQTVIALRGNFNPQIIQPAWLAAQGLIRDAESEKAEVEIIHAEVVVYSLDWAQLEVQLDSLVVKTLPAAVAPEQVRDLVLGIMEVLSHTPVHGVSIQVAGHYALDSQEERDDLLGTLVPLARWEHILQSAETRSLMMRGTRFDEAIGSDGRSLVTVEPSVRLQPEGIYVAVLDQYKVDEIENSTLGTGPAREALNSVWETSARAADAIVSAIFEARVANS